MTKARGRPLTVTIILFIRTPMSPNPPINAASLHEYFGVVERHLDRALLSEASRTKLQLLTSSLPPLSKAILEFRLAGHADQVDLSVSIPRAPLPLSEALLSDPIWGKFQAICDEWLDPTTVIHRLVREIWIELDGSEAMPPIPSPNLFFALDWEAGAREELHEIAGTLVRQALPPSLAHSLSRIRTELLGDVPLAHLGAMLARRTSSLRLVISRVPGALLADYAERIGWTDRDALLRRTMERLQLMADAFYLDFDIQDGVGPRVFVECFIKNPARRKERWREFFDYLISEGLCAEAKAQAVSRWMGINRETQDPARWPQSLRWGDELMQALATSVFVRDISHVKLAFEVGKLIEAKVYLSFEHGWFDRRKLREIFNRQDAHEQAPAQEKKNV